MSKLEDIRHSLQSSAPTAELDKPRIWYQCANCLAEMHYLCEDPEKKQCQCECKSNTASKETESSPFASFRHNIFKDEI